MNAVIGIDFGTQSARALMVDAATGAALHSVSFPYPRGILPGDLVCIDDYHEALDALLSAMADTPWRGNVRGICVDATSLTLVCVDKDGTPLAHLPGFADREQAMVKLWKRHHAESQAREILRGVLRHEFRHHLEFLGGIHNSSSLEAEDERRKRAYLERHGE